MKLTTKTFILIAITWLLFLALVFENLIFGPSILFSAAVVFFAVISLSLISRVLLKRINQLNHQVKNITTDKGLMQRLDIKGRDEISIAADQINAMLAALENDRAALLENTEEQLQKLQSHNQRLQKEITTQFSEGKKIIERTESLTRLAHYDSLTSLPNQIFFNEILNKTMNHAKRHQKFCAILILDIDSLREINLKLGHSAGDEILKELGSRFTNTLRSEDILARAGNDEFIVLLNDIRKPKFASAVAEKLLHAGKKPIKIANHEITPKLSIGICIYPNDGNSLEDLLKNADTALEKAKYNGGNTYQFYTPEMNEEAHEFIQLESALRKAIQRNELVLYYQPKLRIKKGSISGVEALVRWVHPEMGTIDPAKLILLAEETGLIMQVGEWAIREACRMNKYWQDEGFEHLTVAVNISPKQFHHPDLPKIIQRAIDDTQLNPNYLELEIHESAVMNDIEAAKKSLNNIKSTGVLISIDHFGTGYTSISHLKQFPISIVKIDKSFIKGLPHNPNDLAITNALISLAHNLGLEVVAEGVETAEQVQYLASQNCDLIQGYFLSHPLPAQKITSQFTKLGEEVLL